MEKRFIIIATITYIIGIILGLYFKISIAFLLCFTIFCVFFFCGKKNIMYISILIVVLLIGSIYTNYRKKLFDMYENLTAVTVIGKVVNLEKQNEYNKTYKVKVISLDGESTYKKVYIFVKIKNTSSMKLALGDIMRINGMVENPEVRRNYKGFDYKKYLNGRDISTVIVANDISTIKKNSGINIYSIKNYIIEKVENMLSDTNSSICLALILGYKVGVPEEVTKYFEKSNLLHMLSISGMHVSYICLIIDWALNKLDKKISRVLTIILLIIYILLTGGVPSVMRACITQILCIVSVLLYRKSDVFTNLSISAIIILIINPLTIFDIGFIFSYVGTISIIVFNTYIEKLIDILQIKLSMKLKQKIPKQKSKLEIVFSKIVLKIKKIIIISISANILIIPLTMYFFDSLSFVFLISNLLATPVLSCIIIFSIFVISVSVISRSLSLIFANILNLIINIFIIIAKFCSNLPFAKILICSPTIIELLLIYVEIFIIIFLYKKDKLNKEWLLKFIKKMKIKTKKLEIIFLAIFIILIFIFYKSCNTSLKIFFIDVGQGDSTLIITPNNKKILIDGGGSETGSFDVGEKTLLPYLLNRKVKALDYIMISHFDTDHVRRNIIFNGKYQNQKYSNW